MVLHFLMNQLNAIQEMKMVWIDFIKYLSIELMHHCPNTPIILIGTKEDLRYNDELVAEMEAKKTAPVSHEEAEALVRKVKLAAYLPSSALLNKGISPPFTFSLIAPRCEGAI